MIPIIDLKAKDALDRIDEAYTTVGFAVFTNALDRRRQDLMNNWFDQAKKFFDLSLDEKKKYTYQAENNLGYSIVGAEHVDPDAPSDMKESYNYNDTRMPEELWPKTKFFKDELWPDTRFFKDSFAPLKSRNFKDCALRSIRIADELSLRILSHFDEILDSGTTLVDAHQTPYNTTRIIHYPAYTGELEPKQMRIGEHSDYGTITLLWQINDVPGLEVQDLKGDWHSVPYAEDGVVVNIGDLLQRWTNDYFVSTKHRVVNSHIHQERYSMPHFVDPTPGTMITNLRNEPAKYESIESKEYLMWRLAQSY